MKINKQSIDRIIIRIMQGESNLALDYCLAHSLEVLSMNNISGTDDVEVIAEMVVGEE